jgi:hypothetical protein
MNLEKPYSTSKVIDNWYQQRPYTFIFTDKNGKKYKFNLPIAPSNLSINTNFATHVISTMYGTIEEHSEQRYFDIVISGTTGISPQYYNAALEGEQGPLLPTGRKGFQVKPGVNTGGFLQRTKDLIKNTLNQAADLLGSEKKPQNAIEFKQTTGYAAFHNFYKFLLAYKEDVTSKNIKRKNHPLQFVNYKDNNQYDVSISGFQLTRDYSNPMLYNYNITLRGYNLREAGEVEFAQTDILDALGLGGIETSLKAKIANKAKQAKNVAFSGIAAVKGFGK